jgi:ferrous iron transport protein B
MFLQIAFLEDSGYMARAAFIMDKIMHKIGLHGKSFIPMIMGFGCNVPAIMATRTIESRSNRLITMLAIPFMSCSARLPVYLLFTGIFFPNHAGLVMLSLYLIGILLAVVFCRIMSRWFITKDEIPFVMELPPYRTPTWRSLYRHAWERGQQYLRKMGTLILLASVIIWFFSYYPQPNDVSPQTVVPTATNIPNNDSQRQEQSYLGRFGHVIEPVLTPIGMNWKLGIALLTGAGAKEVVAGSLSVLYSGGEQDGESRGIATAMREDGITPFIAYCFLLFVMIYFPCIGVIAAIRSESGSWRWALFSALYTTILAWVITFVVYQVGIRLF